VKLAWSNLAKAALLKLRRSSVERWGRDVAQRYLEDVRAAAKQLTLDPLRAKPLKGPFRVTRPIALPDCTSRYSRRPPDHRSRASRRDGHRAPLGSIPRLTIADWHVLDIDRGTRTSKPSLRAATPAQVGGLRRDLDRYKIRYICITSMPLARMIPAAASRSRPWNGRVIGPQPTDGSALHSGRPRHLAPTV
jgi:plasmid stabilization system protein ParE